MLAPWLLGFCVYQLINPGGISWWLSLWTRVQGWLHFTPASWMSASLLSFLAAGVTTLLLAAVLPRPTAPPVVHNAEVPPSALAD